MTLSTEKVPMRLPMKLGVSLAIHDYLAELNVAEMRDCINQRAIGLRCGNHLQQAHVARWIKEVRAEPGALKFVGESFRDLADREPAGVSGDDRAGPPDGFHFFEQTPFDIEVFNNGLDDPIDVGESSQVVIEIPDGDQTSASEASKKAAGFRLAGVLQADGGRQNAGCSYPRRCRNVQQHGTNAGIGQVSGYPGTHGPGSEYGYFFNYMRMRSCSLTLSYLAGSQPPLAERCPPPPGAATNKSWM